MRNSDIKYVIYYLNSDIEHKLRQMHISTNNNYFFVRLTLKIIYIAYMCVCLCVHLI